MICKPPPNIGTANIADGAVTMGKLGADARPEQNLMSNPGFNFAQQQVPGTLTTIPDNSYGPDCWKATRSTADVQYQRVSNAGTTFISANRGRFKKITNPGQIVIFQPLENLISTGLQGQVANFQLTVQFNTPRTWRPAIINWSGTADQLSAMIASFGVSPMTLNGNFTYLSSYVASSGNGVEIWTIGVTVPATGISNLIFAIMIQDSMAVNDTVDIAEVHGNIGAFFRAPWYPLSGPEDIARCERFYEKSYDTDVAPATVSAVGAIDGTQVAGGTIFPVRYKRKPKAPNITLYSTTGASTKWRDITGAADLSAAAQNTGLAGCGVSVTGGTLAHETAGHFTADSQL